MDLVGGLGRRLVHIQMEEVEVEMMGGMQAIRHLSRVEGGLHTMHGMVGLRHTGVGGVEGVGEQTSNASSVFGESLDAIVWKSPSVALSLVLLFFRGA